MIINLFCYDLYAIPMTFVSKRAALGDTAHAIVDILHIGFDGMVIS